MGMWSQEGLSGQRKIPVPPNRMTPLEKAWLKIYRPIAEHMKLMIRMNTHTRTVEIKVRVVQVLLLSTKRLTHAVCL